MLDRSLAQGVWRLCGVLRDDGITYQDYLTELSWLIYLRAAGSSVVDVQLDEVRHAWQVLKDCPEPERLDWYRAELLRLATCEDPTVAGIFADARTSITRPRILSELINGIEALGWSTVTRACPVDHCGSRLFE